MLSEVQIVLDDRMTDARPVNGVITSGVWLFASRDPQILIETGEGRRLRIRGKIFLMKDMSIAAFLGATADQKKTSRERVTEELVGLREAMERLREAVEWFGENNKTEREMVKKLDERVNGAIQQKEKERQEWLRRFNKQENKRKWIK